MSENLKKIYNENGQWQTSLYFHKVPLTTLFEQIREIDLHKNKERHQMHKDDPEFFLSLKGKDGRKHYYVKVTPKFHTWINRNTFSDLKGKFFEVIQQRSGDQFLDKWLVLLGESQIIASYWLDYKTTEEIKEVFNNA